jgi:hypothetical protein
MESPKGIIFTGSLAAEKLHIISALMHTET